MYEPIRIWNRAENREEAELVYGGAAVNFLYGTRFGQLLADTILSGHPVSKIYGTLQSSPASRSKVEGFVDHFKIPMQEFEGAPFKSFNDFFIRKFKPGMRPFATESNRLAAFAEARYLAWEKVTPEQTFPVKGRFLTAAALMGDSEKARPFAGGPLLVARLCPVDYHRFHYPDDGTTTDHFAVSGRLHSVNPVALKYRDEIFATNERQVSILETRNFGKLAYIEVGALCVGKIVQTHPQTGPFKKGEEKGYFLFGGSTVIVLGEPGRWKPDADLLENTSRSREVLVRLGSGIATTLVG